MEEKKLIKKRIQSRIFKKFKVISNHFFVAYCEFKQIVESIFVIEKMNVFFSINFF